MSDSTTAVRDELDTLIHDAERAESNASLAGNLLRDRAAAARLGRKAVRLREQAQLLADAHGIPLCDHGRIADECTDDTCYQDDDEAEPTP